MNIQDLQSSQNDTKDLPRLDLSRYENIFKVNKNNNFYFYNILKNVNFPDELNEDLYTVKTVNTRRPLTSISHEMYGTQNLWWLILLVNKIRNPVQILPQGIALKIIKPKYVSKVLENIIKLNNG